jgi:hypothetical protein
MDLGTWAHVLKTKVKKFNGEFFRNRAALPLGREEIGELRQAASYTWKEVDPSIFGTLLEQALDPEERQRLGAHYTPRAYVERLVVATVIEPLREDWRNVQATAEIKRASGDLKGAAAEVKAFHDKLCETRVLDPACGTGNFLYVSLELMKRLEGEVLEALLDLGGQEALRGLGSHSVDPHQFLGLEINPRAAAIAELVLWIGYLQWHFRTKGAPPDEPILRAFKNIQVKNAVLTWDGQPVPKIVDGKETYPNARRPEWPAAEFVVGNPPFIGGKDIRARVNYAESLWAVHPHMNESADFVMYWWDRAAELLTRKGTVLRRFGLVTTNSISQVFQRRVMEKHLKAKKPISLVTAIPDHPWTKATQDAAAVRIAMTVCESGSRDGTLQEVTRESELDTDAPVIELTEQVGQINSDLSLGVDLSKCIGLTANEGLSSRGMSLHGSGFIVTKQEAEHLGLGKHEGLERHIREYRNGRDLASHARNVTRHLGTARRRLAWSWQRSALFKIPLLRSLPVSRCQQHPETKNTRHRGRTRRTSQACVGRASASDADRPLQRAGRAARRKKPDDLEQHDRNIFDDGLMLIMKELHDKIDVAVAEAYGWPPDLSDDEILARLVALNKERSEEEKRGLVRWLRPDYQIPRFAKGVDKQAAREEGAQVAAELIAAVEQKPLFPSGAVEQTAAVFAALAAASEPLDAKGFAAQFRRTKTTEKKVGEVLASLARLGYVTSEDGKTFALRRVA